MQFIYLPDSDAGLLKLETRKDCWTTFFLESEEFCTVKLLAISKSINNYVVSKYYVSGAVLTSRTKADVLLFFFSLEQKFSYLFISPERQRIKAWSPTANSATASWKLQASSVSFGLYIYFLLHLVWKNIWRKVRF